MPPQGRVFARLTAGLVLAGFFLASGARAHEEDKIGQIAAGSLSATFPAASSTLNITLEGSLLFHGQEKTSKSLYTCCT